MEACWEVYGTNLAEEAIKVASDHIAADEIYPDAETAINQIRKNWIATRENYTAGAYDLRDSRLLLCPAETSTAMEVELYGHARNDLIAAAVAHLIVSGSLQSRRLPLPSLPDCVATMEQLRAFANGHSHRMPTDLVLACARVIVYCASEAVVCKYETPASRLVSIAPVSTNPQGVEMIKQYTAMCPADRENFDRSLDAARVECARFLRCISNGDVVPRDSIQATQVLFATNIFTAFFGRALYRFWYVDDFFDRHESVPLAPALPGLVRCQKRISELLATIDRNDAMLLTVRKIYAQMALPLGSYEDDMRCRDAARDSVEPSSLLQHISSPEDYDAFVVQFDAQAALFDTPEGRNAIRLDYTKLDDPWHIAVVDSRMRALFRMSLFAGHIVFGAELYAFEHRLYPSPSPFSIPRPPVMVFVDREWCVQLPGKVIRCGRFVIAFAVWCCVMAQLPSGCFLENGTDISHVIESFIGEDPDDCGNVAPGVDYTLATASVEPEPVEPEDPPSTNRVLRPHPMRTDVSDTIRQYFNVYSTDVEPDAD